MVFFGQVVSNIVTLVLFACALFIVLRHAIHSVQAVGQMVTFGAWGKTSADLLIRRVATSVGIVVAMTSSFGLQWWLTMGSVPGSAPRVPHLDEFLNHFLSRFVSGLFGEYPWIWVSGTLGTAVWVARLLLLVGAAAFCILLLRNILDPRIRDKDAFWTTPLNCLTGFLAMAMVTYWWPAGMGDRPFFTVVMVILCFMGLGTIGGIMQGNASPSSPSSARSSSMGWEEQQSRSKKAPDEDEYATGRRKRDEQAKDAAKKWQEDERKAWEKRDKDEKDRREDEAEKNRKNKDAEDARRREQNRKDEEDLAWRLKEEAQKAAWEAEQRRKDDEHRRKQ